MPIPSSPYEDYQKTGLDKLIKLGKAMCLLVLTFEVIIRSKFPDSVPINALLDAIKVLCALIPAADAEFKEFSLNVTPPPSDSADTAGINPDAPDAEAPDFT